MAPVDQFGCGMAKLGGAPVRATPSRAPSSASARCRPRRSWSPTKFSDAGPLHRHRCPGERRQIDGSAARTWCHGWCWRTTALRSCPAGTVRLSCAVVQVSAAADTQVVAQRRVAAGRDRDRLAPACRCGWCRSRRARRSRCRVRGAPVGVDHAGGRRVQVVAPDSKPGFSAAVRGTAAAAGRADRPGERRAARCRRWCPCAVTVTVKVPGGGRRAGDQRRSRR